MQNNTSRHTSVARQRAKCRHDEHDQHPKYGQTQGGNDLALQLTTEGPKVNDDASNKI